MLLSQNEQFGLFLALNSRTIQLLSRKTFSQAEKFEKKVFGTRQLGVNGDVNTGQGNRSLNSEHEPTGLAESYGG